ncbi:3-isopropylmalate dehydrogenase [Microbacterium soli]|uniref:3-isopropylmalate dehydrogenase n=1 Tax=Microbacterium soli TaxID=446075 RepID=A0ABP7MUI2_9MICO
MTEQIRIAVLPGDGIGPEVIREASLVLRAAAQAEGIRIELIEGLLGGVAIQACGVPLPEETMELVRGSSAVLAGAVGGPAWDSLPERLNPGLGGMLRLRRELDLFANLRPVVSLPGASPFLDILLVREATGGAYFSMPRGRAAAEEVRAFDTIMYSEAQITRVIRVAADLAESRSGRLASIDKANVLESSRLWREVAERELAGWDIEVEHLYVDNAAYQLARDPSRFDVIVTENMFGDILSDQLAGALGSLGLLPSAGLGTGTFGLYEPVHGSAFDITEHDVANPIGAIRSAAMLLRHSLGAIAAARRIDDACTAVLSEGFGTRDTHPIHDVGTRELTRRILERMR